MVPLQSAFASESTFRFSLPTHTSEHSYYSRLPLPMWRVHLKALGAMHILSQSPQPADLTLAAGRTRDDFSLRRSLVSSLLARLRQLADSCVRNLLFIPGCKAPRPQSPVPSGWPATRTFPSVQPSTWRWPRLLALPMLTYQNHYISPMLVCRKRCVSSLKLLRRKQNLEKRKRTT